MREISFIRENDPAIKLLNNIIELEREKKPIPKTYIFYGPEISGKEYIALNFLSVINNEEKNIKEFSSIDLKPIITSINIPRLKDLLNIYKKNRKVQNILINQLRKVLIYLREYIYNRKDIEETEEDILIINEFIENYDEKLLKNIEEIINRIKTFKIPIEIIRETLKDLYVIPNNKYKILFIKYIEELDIEGLNTILKTIEEGPNHLITVMISKRLDRVIPTIKSRALRIRIRPYTKIEKESIGLDNIIIYKKYNIKDIDNIDITELPYFIDYLKSFFPGFSPYEIDKIKYLNTLKESIIFNTDPEYIKESLRIFTEKYINLNFIC
ncbi:MAG TPA: hypothetical protein PKW55_07105 [Spirochaetota bacterium]|nr:hypothetical protein [Spirochaetota bacterium]HOM38716.1 hypothetical protein [Spirochaetota bacterium]HPQ49513.1 hypothetical protein [Spirochaetota bacterium]